jgi:hypothetical protein
MIFSELSNINGEAPPPGPAVRCGVRRQRARVFTSTSPDKLARVMQPFIYRTDF